MDRGPVPKRSSGSRAAGLAALVIMLAVLGLTVFSYYSPGPSEPSAAATRMREAPAIAAAKDRTREVRLFLDGQGVKVNAANLGPQSAPFRYEQIYADHGGSPQFNMAVPGRSTVSTGSSGHKKLFLILAFAGAGAAGAIVAASGGGSSSTSGTPATPPIVISPGSGTVGPPR